MYCIDHVLFVLVVVEVVVVVSVNSFAGHSLFHSIVFFTVLMIFHVKQCDLQYFTPEDSLCNS